MKTTAVLILLTFALLYASTAHADTFGSGAKQFDIEFVSIGNADNPDDTTGSPNPAGKVEYAYRIGQFEISEDMIDKANNEGGLGITKPQQTGHQCELAGGSDVCELAQRRCRQHPRLQVFGQHVRGVASGRYGGLRRLEYLSQQAG